MTKRQTGLSACIAATLGALLVATAGTAPARAADKLSELHVDYAYYNPVSLVLKDKGWLEQEFKKDGTRVRWVLSLGSNKALEFLNAGSLDFGSSAGAAALIAYVNGNPIRTVYVYSKPEWTALVTRPDTGIKTVAELRGKRIAVTRGTDPHIFLVRALQSAGLTQKDVTLVLLQHQDGRVALDKGDVDAWAGLDPMMAQAQLENHDVLFYRNPDFNTYGVLSVRQAFAQQHPDIVERVLAVYERGRRWSLAHPHQLAQILEKAAHVSPAVANLQLTERTDLRDPTLNPKVHDSIREAGVALQKAGVIRADADVAKATESLLDSAYFAKLAVR
jgi:sulfonate transport system substrate-binding protein